MPEEEYDTTKKIGRVGWNTLEKESGQVKKKFYLLVDEAEEENSPVYVCVSVSGSVPVSTHTHTRILSGVPYSVHLDMIGGTQDVAKNNTIVVGRSVTNGRPTL